MLYRRFAFTSMIELQCCGGLEAHASRDHTLVGTLREGFRESRRCSRDIYPESYITKYNRLPVKHVALNATTHARPFVGASSCRSWSHLVVLGAIWSAFIAKS